MFPLFYNLGLALYFFLFALPKGIYEYFQYGKHEESFRKRMGYSFPKISKGDKKLVWLHAVSMGETKAIVEIARFYKEKGWFVLISSTSETGHAEAKKAIPFADVWVYLPLDFSFIIDPIVAQVKPDLVLLSESDVWYSFLTAAKKEGAKIALLSGKLSERSFLRLMDFPFVAKALYNPIDLFLLQSEEYKKRFETLFKKIGLNKKLLITGNLKFDEKYPFLKEEEKKVLLEDLGLKEGDYVLTAGSTHAPEEELLLSLFPHLLEKKPSLKLVIVPRHPERFPVVKELIAKTGIPFVAFSEKEKKKGGEQIFLIDAMGVLRKMYSISKIAYVGGTFTEKVGGHNLLEPIFYSVPTVFGPYTFTQKELHKIALEKGAAIQVKTKEELGEVLEKLLTEETFWEKIGAQGHLTIESIRGSKERTLEALEKDL